MKFEMVVKPHKSKKDCGYCNPSNIKFIFVVTVVTIYFFMGFVSFPTNAKW